MASPVFKKRIRLMLGGLCVVSLGIACFPVVASRTSLGNWLVARLIGNEQLRVSVGQCSLGWTSPVRLAGLAVTEQQQRWRLHVEQVMARPWPRLWWHFPDLGEVDFNRPSLDIIATTSMPELLPPPRGRRPTLQGSVQQAAVQVRTDHSAAPVIQIDGLDVRFQISETAGGRALQLEPVTLLQQEPLTPEMFERGLQLVAPVLARTAAFTGSASLRLDDCLVPLDESPESVPEPGPRVSGVLTFHRVSAGLKNPLLLQLTAAVSRLLQRELPTRVRIVENSEVNFRLVDGRVHHDSLTFVLPELSDDLVIVSTGSVGLDETVDLQLEVPLPLTLIRDGPLARRLSERPLLFHVGGTLERPALRFRGNNGWLDGLIDAIDADGTEPSKITGSILGIVDEVLQPDPETGQAPWETVLERIRQRRQERRRRSQQQEQQEQE